MLPRISITHEPAADGQATHNQKFRISRVRWVSIYCHRSVIEGRVASIIYDIVNINKLCLLSKWHNSVVWDAQESISESTHYKVYT